ncbi:uncharacterized protein LOC111698769 isoform X2 [Eurytemora carolleeae]|uniref:uncharacterized protein LOC111698769 isoform X2 n=1 Tax=Eurytemora carolleeae TaxID=1294199 RepID=UPI000C75741C|nr:uncharacterized protein LOC111698769 isoform X2 [Eurytemora carolleeae]|eukprot:XP_023324966.1 uncharacterized protein LOC111698769 isoform X2 [Eurytemora affinis]
MLQLRNDELHKVLMPILGDLWDNNKFLDGVFTCCDGVVRFSRFLVSCYSSRLENLLRTVEENVETNLVVKDFRVSVVRGVVRLLHGCPEVFYTLQNQETKEFIRILGIELRGDNVTEFTNFKKRKFEEDDDVIITFDEKKEYKTGRIQTKLRTPYHTRRYTDWGNRSPRRQSEEKNSDFTFVRVNYEKAEIKTEIEEEPETNLEIDIDACVDDFADESDPDYYIPASKVENEAEGEEVQGLNLLREDEAKEIAASFMDKQNTGKYLCTFNSSCRFTNSSLQILQDHVLKHLDIVIQQCDHCGFKTRKQSDLDKHMRTNHLTGNLEVKSSLNSNKEETSRFRRSVRNKQKINRSETGESEGIQDMMKEEREGQDSQEDHEDQDSQEDQDGQEDQEAQDSQEDQENQEAQEDQEDQDGQVDQEDQEDQVELVIEPISVDGDKYSINSFGEILVLEGHAKDLASKYLTREEMEFTCLLCHRFQKDRRFEDEEKILVHIFKHLNIYSLQCSSCLRGFRMGSELAQHQQICSDQDDGLSAEKFINSPVQPVSTINKKAVFMTEKKAQKIISSYVICQDNEASGTKDYTCGLCDFKCPQESTVTEHVALQHLNIFQFKCAHCGIKFKLRTQLENHEREKHRLKMFPELKNEDGFEQDNQQGTLVLVKETRIQQFEERNDEDDMNISMNEFPYLENGFLGKTTHGGTKLVYVEGSEYPLTRPTKSTLMKIMKARLVSKEEGNRLVATSFLHNIQTKKYECTLCNGVFQADTITLIQRHLYEHMNLYVHKCELCGDVFRNVAQFKEHKEMHKKRLEEKEEEIKNFNSSQDKIGDYHLEEKEVYIRLSESKPIIESYFSIDSSTPGINSFSCKLCLFARDNYSLVFNHCLRKHLKIALYQCESKKCSAQFKFLEDLRKHYTSSHNQKFKCEEGEETMEDDLETDFPNLEDISGIPIDQLHGKKISHVQAKSLRGQFIIQNQRTKVFECELCDYKSEWKVTLQSHVMIKHYDVYIYRCKECKQLMRSWNQFLVHKRTHKPKNDSKTNSEVKSEYHTLTEPIFLGEEAGKKAAEQYVFYDKKEKCQRCKMCPYSSKKTQLVAMHALAKHLPAIHLYRCEYCQKEFRYSRSRYREHLLVHTEGKLNCSQCPPDSTSTYTREALKTHLKNFHTAGEFPCVVQGCETVLPTKSELREHQSTEHSTLMRGKDNMFHCYICDYQFPTRTRLNKHVKICEAGRTKTLFRKQISDVLQWIEKGSYRCTFCQAEFHPEPGDVTLTGLPEARNHVVNVHGMRHMRRLKMGWLGEPATLDKSERYKDKSYIWEQKMKDIEKARKLEIQQTNIQNIQQEVSQNIARAATSYQTMLEALSQTGGPAPTESVLLEVIGKGNVVKKEEAGWREEGEEGWRDDEPRDWGQGVDRIYLNVVEEDCIVSQSEVYIQEKGDGEDQENENQVFVETESTEEQNILVTNQDGVMVHHVLRPQSPSDPHSILSNVNLEGNVQFFLEDGREAIVETIEIEI